LERVSAIPRLPLLLRVIQTGTSIHLIRCLTIRFFFAENMAKNPTVASRITFVEKAVSAKSGETVSFCESAAGSRCDPTGLLKVNTISVDDFVNSEKLPRVDFIKMDIEGSELSALRGSSDTLRRFCPKLAISIYHRPKDLYEILEFISSVGVVFGHRSICKGPR
jgi:FkbM family methyltransferase